MISIDLDRSQTVEELLLQSSETSDKSDALTDTLDSEVAWKSSASATQLLYKGQTTISGDESDLASAGGSVAEIIEDQYEAARAAIDGGNGYPGIDHTQDLFGEITVLDILRAQYEVARAAVGKDHPIIAITYSDDQSLADMVKDAYASFIAAGSGTDCPVLEVRYSGNKSLDEFLKDVDDANLIVNCGCHEHGAGAGAGIESSGRIDYGHTAADFKADLAIALTGNYSPPADLDFILIA